jgi:hypothetical protein
VNGFLVTYGPEPRTWCTCCRTDITLVTRLDGTFRPDDVEQAQRGHLCPPLSGADQEDDPVMAAYYRDLAEVNQAIANLYRYRPAPDPDLCEQSAPLEGTVTNDPYA